MRSLSSHGLFVLGFAWLTLTVATNLAPPAPAFAAHSPMMAPTDVQMPGTQPGEAAVLGPVGSCEICHGHYDPVAEPFENWKGSMMAQAGRDPVFWAALAVAEGDIPGSGDFCIRCHSPRGWHEGRAVPTDGSGLDPLVDHQGIECGICHQLVDPDGSEHAGQMNAPFVANTGGAQPEGFYGSGMQVLAGDQVRYGPYAQTAASHPYTQSKFHRSAEICGTCHDVSNPLAGDLAPNNGAHAPLPAGQFSGVPGAPVTQKAAFLNPPYAYGIVERTFSEHFASALSNTLVSDFPSLPQDLQRGALKRAYDQALLAGNGGNHADGADRFFSCQACHIEPVVGEGAAFGLAPVRNDLPRHDLTGGNTWAPEAIQWLDSQSPSRLRLGQNIGPVENAAIDRGVERARASLQRAGALDVVNDNQTLRVTNLTGHKLITGYPEGRRMWLRVRWLDEQLQVVREDGSYDSFAATVNGSNVTVSTITDPNARIYQAKLGITQDWALELLLMGVDPTTPLAFDRATGATTMTLAALAAMPAGTEQESFHFVLNNKLKSDTRIPPYGLDRDEAVRRNAQPIPATQYGNPAPGGVYDYFDDVALAPPAGATRAEFELLYQTSSWEYIQFLLLANPGSSAFLASAGQDLFDAYMATGQSAPELMTTARWCNMPGTNEDLVLKTAVNGAAFDESCAKRVAAGDSLDIEVTSPNNTHQANVGALAMQIHTPGAPPLSGLLPGLWLNQADGLVVIPGLPTGSWNFSITLPPGLANQMFRFQALMLTASPTNGLFALSNAFDFYQE
ncbi:MAG: hypothetical protein AB8H80_22910 [Planctomycetota bacterium]